MISPGVSKDRLDWPAFPVPQSCNHIWEPTTFYQNGKPKAGIRLSKEARMYEDQEVISYKLRNGVLIAQTKLVMQEWLRLEMFIRIDVFIVMPGTSIWTMKGDKRRFDHFNFTKLIHDGVSTLTECDDKFYFAGYQELLEGPLNKAFCDIVLTPHKPRGYGDHKKSIMASIN